jgi:NAD-dependent dihydropyrimidine dehydrogenase PreA subunit
MRAEIYYFSGTGNSLFIAREIQKRIPGSYLTPVIRKLHEPEVASDADTVGFVFPNFCLSVPIPVHDLLEKLKVTPSQYIFAVCSRGGSPSKAFDQIDAALKKSGNRLKAQLNINMPWNHPLGKEDLPGRATKENLDLLHSEMHRKLDIFCGSINSKKEYIKEDDGVIMKLPSFIKVFDLLIPESLDYKMHIDLYRKKLSFYADEKCSGCGTCEAVCPAGKIRLNGGKPVWDKDTNCYACYACINYCPRQSIQITSSFPIRSYTDKNGRYHHQSVTCADIARQRFVPDK